MKVTLNQKEYDAISVIVRQGLRKLIKNDLVAGDDLIFGPEFMSKPLRISTPSTHYEFSAIQKKYMTTLRKEIKNAEMTQEEKTLKLQQLESIILFGKILFSQSASLHFLQNSLNKEYTNNQVIKENVLSLQLLVKEEGIKSDSSRFEALSRRKKFKQLKQETIQSINDSSLNFLEKKELLSDVSKACGFYYQCNDLNFINAHKSSRSFSKFVNSYQRYGSKVSLTASIIAIGAGSLALIPALAPVMGPIALAALAIALVIGVPLALKTTGTMLYNFIRFRAEPTPAELVTTALIGTSLLLMGVGSIIGQAVASGVLAQTANLVTQNITLVNNVTKASLGLVGEVKDLKEQIIVHRYKSVLENIKHNDTDDYGIALEPL